MNHQRETALQRPLPLQLAIRPIHQRKLFGIDGVRDHRHALRRDAPAEDVGAQAFADRRHSVGALQHPRFECARQLVAQAAFAGRAVVDRGVFPERAHFVDDGYPSRTRGAQCRDSVEGRRMRVNQIRARLFEHLLESSLRVANDAQLIQDGQRTYAAAGDACAEKAANRRTPLHRAARRCAWTT